MKIVVTGALGHIGSKLIRSFASAYPGSSIVLIDNMLTQRYCSLFDLPRGANYKFIEGDIRTLNFADTIDGADVVVHLAAITDAANSFDNSQLVEDTNFIATQRLAEACSAGGVPLLFPSTTSVYGTQASIVDESCGDDELKPQSPYASSKLKAEKWLAQRAKESPLKFVTCRLGTIFGTSIGMRFHTAINKFCWQAILGQPITVWKTALNQNRPYLDLQDAIEGIQFIINNKLFDGQTYNFVTINTSVGNIIEVIRPHVSDLKIEYVETKIMNQLSYHVRAEKIREKGFCFSGDLKKGVGETLTLLKALGNSL